MKNLSPLIVSIVLVLSQAAAATPADVEAALEKYRIAILNADPEAAYQSIDTNTKAYYDQLFDDVAFATADQVHAKPLLDRVTIVMTRHRIPVEELQNLDGPSLFKYAVANDWVGKGSVAATAITDIRITGDTATTKLMMGGQVAPFGFTFRKEQGEWKIDLTSVMPMANSAFEQTIQAAGLQENAFIFQSVEAASGHPVDPSVWDAPLER